MRKVKVIVPGMWCSGHLIVKDISKSAGDTD